MKEFKKNPRKISAYELERLKSNIEELGDLSGIVHDVESDEIITGNQRTKALELSESDIVLTEEFDSPDTQGTIGLGYILAKDGTKLNYRRVKWDSSRRDKANITANKLGGDWDWEILNSDSWERDVLIDAGFDHLDFEQEKVDINDGDKSGKTRTTKFFTLEVLFPNKEDYLLVTKIIDKSKNPGETIAETLKRLLSDGKS